MVSAWGWGACAGFSSTCTTCAENIAALRAVSKRKLELLTARLLFCAGLRRAVRAWLRSPRVWADLHEREVESTVRWL